MTNTRWWYSQKRLVCQAIWTQVKRKNHVRCLNQRRNWHQLEKVRWDGSLSWKEEKEVWARATWIKVLNFRAIKKECQVTLTNNLEKSREHWWLNRSTKSWEQKKEALWRVQKERRLCRFERYRIGWKISRLRAEWRRKVNSRKVQEKWWRNWWSSW